MRLSNGIYCVVILALISASTRLWAHHSFAAEYDGTKPIKLSGTVTKFDMVNPHSWIYIDVKDDTGKVVNWKFETASPSNLYRLGAVIFGSERMVCPQARARGDESQNHHAVDAITRTHVWSPRD